MPWPHVVAVGSGTILNRSCYLDQAAYCQETIHNAYTLAYYLASIFQQTSLFQNETRVQQWWQYDIMNAGRDIAWLLTPFIP